MDEGIRRTLSSDPLNEGRDQARLPRTAAAGDRAGALDRRRNLQDSACTTQMWIMVDEAKMVNGFPFCECFGGEKRVGGTCSCSHAVVIVPTTTRSRRGE